MNKIRSCLVLVSFRRLFVEELKQHHPEYLNVSVNDRERVKEVLPLKIFSFLMNFNE